LEPDETPESVSFMEFPGRQAHTGLAPNESALRALLEAPPGLSLVQWQIAPASIFYPQLKGCTWQLVGALVSDTHEHPGYPYFQYAIPHHTRLQTWLWRTSKTEGRYHRGAGFGWNLPWGDLRWHPERGLRKVLELGPSDGPDVREQVWDWIHVSQRASRGRRRRRVQEDVQRLQLAAALIRRSAANGGPTEIEWIATLLNTALKRKNVRPSARTSTRQDESVQRDLQRRCARQLLSWDDVVRLALAGGL
jgi:hypothetical protein